MSSTSLDLRRPETRGVDYVERARALAPMLAAASDEIEERRQLPEYVVEALIEGGFFRLLLPRSLGGAELDPVTYVQVLEEIAKADPSTAWCLGQNSGCSMTAPYLDPAVAREIFGPPRGILAWGPELPGAGRGVAVEGGIRVTGRWGFATGSRHANWLGAHVPIFEPDGTPRLNPNGRPFGFMRCVPTGSNTGTCAPSQVACRLPVANPQRPVTRMPPSTATLRPAPGSSGPQARMPRGGPKISRATIGSR